MDVGYLETCPHVAGRSAEHEGPSIEYGASTPNSYYDSQYRKPIYPVLWYFGFLGTELQLHSHVASFAHEQRHVGIAARTILNLMYECVVRYIRSYIRTYVCTYARMHICMYSCLHVCMYVRTYVFM